LEGEGGGRRMTTKSSADAARTRVLVGSRMFRRKGNEECMSGNPYGCLSCVCCIPVLTRATSNDGHHAFHFHSHHIYNAFHFGLHPPFPCHPLHPNRDALGRKVEADIEAKTDFNSLKNQWDSIEKDFHTWSKEVRGKGGREGGREGGMEGSVGKKLKISTLYF